MRRSVGRCFALGVVLFASLLCAERAYALSVAGIDFSDFLLLDLEATSDLSLSTSGDIYLFVPGGLHAATVDFVARENIIVNVPVAASGLISMCTEPICVAQPPTVFHDVVVYVSGVAGQLDVDSGGSIVLDGV